MIYLFTGNSLALVRDNVFKWKKIFVSKHGDFNLIHIKNILDFDNNFIYENLIAGSFLGEKKLVIIDDIPLNSKEKGKEKKEKEDFIYSILDKIPEDNIVLFSSVLPDKRGKFYKQLKKKGEVKEFNSLGEDDISFKLKQKYGDKLHFNAVKEIIRYKGGNIDKIIPEIDKLLITKQSISKYDIVENIYPELEESVFILIDYILNLDPVDAIHKMEIILDTVNVYAFYNNLLSNLRTTFYIQKLKSLRVSKHDTIKALNLGKKGFLYDKNYKINFQQLTSFYVALIELDKKMKTGMMIGTEANDFKFEMEKVFIENLT